LAEWEKLRIFAFGFNVETHVAPRPVAGGNASAAQPGGQRPSRPHAASHHGFDPYKIDPFET